MTAAITASPSTPAPSSLVAVSGAGFADAKTRLLLDGVVASTNQCSLPSGTFTVNVTVGSAAGTQTITAEQYVAGAWSVVATTTVTVTGTAPPAGGSYPTTRAMGYLSTTTAAVPSLPGYLSPIIDATWGTQITRVSNVNGRRHAYATIPAWNSDQSKILLGYTYPGRMIDGSTYADIGSFSQINGFVWSNTNNNKGYGWASGSGLGGTIFYSQNATSGALTTLRDFAGDGYSAISIGAYEGGISDDDTKVALLATITTHTWLLIYNIATNTILATKDLGTGSIDNCKISRTGAYVVVVASALGGTRAYPASLVGSGTLLTSSANHGDTALDANGNDIFVACSTGVGVQSYLLSSGAGTQLLPEGTAYGYGHVSGRNTTLPGWIYLSSYDSVTTAGRRGVDQLIAVKTDGSQLVRVYGYANNRTDGSTYNAQPHAVTSRDGTRVLFASCWGTNPATVYAFIAEAAP